ncbi:MAG: DUF481 domain-containing protein [Verrucomicrobiota bacterium]
MNRNSLIALALTLTAAHAPADTVLTTDGARLTGTITLIDKGTIHLDTPYAGSLKIDQEQVASFETKEPVFVRLQSGTVMSGPVQSSGNGKLKIRSQDGVLETDTARVTASWSPDAEDPEVVRNRREWRYDASLDLTGRSGNTDKFAFGAGLNAQLKGPDDTLAFFFEYEQADTEGEKTEDRTAGGASYESFFSRIVGWYARTELEQDRIDAMLRRAMKARERRDYDKAILLAEKVLRINRANTMAHGLIATARRERHKYLRQITADRWDEEHKLLSEHIRQSMLPQLDFVVYPDDWHDIDARRGAPVHGGEQEAQAWKEDIKKKLEQQLVLNFPEMEIQQVVNFLQRNADVNFILDPEVVARGETPPVTMQVKNIKLANALDFIMLQTGLKYALQDEAVYISTPENLQGEAYMKIYEIRDMMVGLTQFPGPSLDIPDPGGQGGALGLEETEDEDAPDVNDFIDIIESVVRPEAWGGDNVSIDEWNGSLIVTQTADVHEEIDKVLRALRNQQAVQINVKVKFLSVENAMLEEIGINWNNFGPTGWRNPIAAGPNPETPASAPPWWLGAYWRSNGSAPDHIIGAQLTNDLQDYSSGSQLTAEGGFNGEIQVFEDPEGFLGRMIIKAVEKSRRGNVAIQPDITLMSGQRSHISRLNQQSYIADYNVVDDQYDPQVTTISYGTVLDVVALASADRRWITLTLRPTTTNITAWRRFGSNIADFGGIDVVNTDADGQDLDAVAGAYPMMVPEVQYRAVETSVVPEPHPLPRSSVLLERAQRA